MRAATPFEGGRPRTGISASTIRLAASARSSEFGQANVIALGGVTLVS
jgi:hypothetical protein